jgi:PAS domain-containing protein
MNPWHIPQSDLLSWVSTHRGELTIALLDAVDDMVFIKDLEGRFVFNNAAHLAFLQRDHAAVTGRTDFELFSAEEAEGFFAHDTRVLETQQPVVSVHPATDASGRRVIDVACKHVVRGPGEVVLGLAGIVKRVVVGEDTAACRDAVMATVRRMFGSAATPGQLAALQQSVTDLL